MTLIKSNRPVNLEKTIRSNASSCPFKNALQFWWQWHNVQTDYCLSICKSLSSLNLKKVESDLLIEINWFHRRLLAMKTNTRATCIIHNSEIGTDFFRCCSNRTFFNYHCIFFFQKMATGCNWMLEINILSYNLENENHPKRKM